MSGSPRGRQPGKCPPHHTPRLVHTSSEPAMVGGTGCTHRDASEPSLFLHSWTTRNCHMDDPGWIKYVKQFDPMLQVPGSHIAEAKVDFSNWRKKQNKIRLGLLLGTISCYGDTQMLWVERCFPPHTPFPSHSSDTPGIARLCIHQVRMQQACLRDHGCK